MLNGIRRHADRQGGSTRLIALASCAVGAVVGAGLLLAQVGAPNPTAANETINGGYCLRIGLCATLASTDCLEAGNGSGCVDVVASPSYNVDCTTPAGLPNGCTGIAQAAPCAVIQVGVCENYEESGTWVGTCYSDTGNTNYGTYYKCTQ